ncbi:hypothetical protein PVAND_006095 [Polypedilum vanderplanki]|uniref:Uncharacterized protein n=1 Tax=Polypedilum vanderplanki TaxID=319348 RepID=A0A9J6C3X9_POLVA|nr:hypothetical protein PVAND_006095 [Polypedilum vanderplanki]
MRKILLHIEESNQSELMNMLQNKSTDINKDLLNILSTNRKYQNIKINVDYGWDFIDQLVRNLSLSLVEVEVSCDIFLENLKIPLLTSLKLDNPIIEGLLTCSDKLVKIIASVSGKELWQKRESPIALKNALKVNTNLKILHIDEVLTEGIFEKDLTCQLKNLNEISLKCLKSFDLKLYGNIRNFLNYQINLEHLSIDYPDIFTVQWIYGNLNNLKSLKMKIHFEQNPRDLNLGVNTSIKKLDINITACWQYSMNIKYALRNFITTSPNMEIFSIPSSLELDDFRFLLFNAKKLKKFVQNYDDCLNNYQEIHEQMKQDHENISEYVEFIRVSD